MAQQSNSAFLNITVLDGDDLGPVFQYASCPTSQYKPCVRPKYSASIQSGTTTVSLSKIVGVISV